MTPLTLYASQALAEEHIAKLHELADSERQLRSLRRRQANGTRTRSWRLRRHAALAR